jgi:tripartite-type tricarboxylate transporter receptor subunit TctC
MRRFKRTMMGLAALAAAAAPARAEDYPSQAVRVLVGFAAGGAPDTLARTVGQRLAERWRQPVVVENRVGAQGNIAMAAVAKAPPDGYTLALVPVGNAAVNPTLFPELPYDIARDFAPVTRLAEVENVLVVSGQSPISSVAELVAAAKAAPAPLTYATPGAGSLAHLAAELLGRGAGFAVRHVPYRGVSPALTDVIRGEVTMTFAQLSTAKPFIESGALKALGVASPRRSPLLPSVPTVAEAAGLPGFEAVSWYALMAPARTPPAVLAKLHDDAAAVLASPEVRASLEPLGALPAPTTPADLTRLIAEDGARWGKIVREAGIRPE